ncbi:MAG TPA: TetR/AcrR family transcriptional regulator [Candidatus Cloacimonadota bacterium]|jgi:TetR/AcrR family fatty acid metabolism transcriptional regulator|nr:TetR/AcrR family transcriptional regulator [Candidatus Cloacimonadota bacterium]HQO44061.1 TetR/AcrR family transcriptional regulator [Candidatus Cloacimonadota bacterium]
MELYPRPRKKSVMPKDYRNKILTAAVKVFAQKGYVNTTMSDVSIHAKVGIGTLYNYFKNKDDLLLQCMKKMIEDEIQQIEAASADITDPIDKLETFFLRHSELILSKPHVARFMVVELRQSESFYKRNPSYNPMNYYLSYLKSIFSEAMKSGRIKNVNIDTLCFMILGTMDFTFTQWLISGKTLDIKPIIMDVRSILRTGIGK